MELYKIDRDSDTPLYIQIRECIVEAIQSKTLNPGDKLPSVSCLAKDIGVTQATIRRALKDLGNAGHTECHVGRGTFIIDADKQKSKVNTKAESQQRKAGQPDKTQFSRSHPLEFAARRLRSGVSKALYDIMPLANKPGIIQLTKGVPDAGLLPGNFIEDITRETLKDGSEHFIQATDAMGMLELREQIANRFNRDGARITPDQVLITNGSLQGITLVAEAALENNPGIICETPCFQGITDTFSALGHWVETIQRDEHGPMIEKLNHLPENNAQLLYLCPYAHNPMGTDLGSDRYHQLVEWAQKTGSVVIADEIFKDLRFREPPLPSLYNALGGDRTIVVSSLSKSIMTGLRLGWLISSEDRIRRLAQLKRLMDHSCPSMIQGMALSIFKSGKFDEHTARMQGIYKDRMQTMVRSLKQLMPQGVTWSKPVGGFSILVQLPKGYSSVALLLSAIERGVSFLPGPLFDIDQRYVHALRLSTAWADKHQIKEGIELLSAAIEELISQPPGDSGLSGLGNFQ